MAQSKNAANALFVALKEKSDAIFRTVSAEIAECQNVDTIKDLERIQQKHATKSKWITCNLIDNDTLLSVFYRLDDEAIEAIVNASYMTAKFASLAACIKTKTQSACKDDTTSQMLYWFSKSGFNVKDINKNTFKIKTKINNYRNVHDGTQQGYVLNLLERVGALESYSIERVKHYKTINDSPVIKALREITFVDPAAN